jgi:Amidohydrolase
VRDGSRSTSAIPDGVTSTPVLKFDYGYYVPSLALQHPDLAAEQLEHAVKRLGLRGALIGGSVNGEELSDPKFHPFWAKAEQLGMLIFIHPQGTAELSASGRLKGNGVLDNVIGNPLETTIALSHLIFEGTLDAYPGLKICAAHAGGYLPSYAARSDQGCVTFPQRCTKTLDKKPTEYLRQLLLRFDGLHTGGTAPPGRRGRRKPDRTGDGLSFSLDQDGGRPRPYDRRAERCRARGDPRRDCGEAPGDQAGVNHKYRASREARCKKPRVRAFTSADIDKIL